MKKAALIIVSFVFCFTGSTCRKKLSEPINLYGMWISNGGYCGYMYIDLKKEGQSEYGTDAYYHGCGNKNWRGRARINDRKLYIGITQFKILEKPTLVETNDTMGWGDKEGRVTAKMRLRTTLLHASTVYTFYKIKDY